MVLFPATNLAISWGRILDLQVSRENKCPKKQPVGMCRCCFATTCTMMRVFPSTDTMQGMREKRKRFVYHSLSLV